MRHPTLLLVLGVMTLGGCHQMTVKVARTRRATADILRAPRLPAVKRIIFLSPKESRCAASCSASDTADGRRFASWMERALLRRGYDIVSGSVMSRVEAMLGGNRTREKWDRLEKALLLGKRAGADAIFQVSALYVSRDMQTFLAQNPADLSMVVVPTRFAESVVKASPTASMLNVPYWVVAVEARLIGMDGRLLWTGSQSVRLTDFLPEDWQAKVISTHPTATVATTTKNEKTGPDQNYDYQLYYYNTELQRAQMLGIIKNLVRSMPNPKAPARDTAIAGPAPAGER